VGVEKVFFRKSAEIASRQDALQTTFSIPVDIFYPQICGCFSRKRLFQQPHLFSPTIGVAARLKAANSFFEFFRCSNWRG
jgi:hypothetical protein